VRTEGKVRRLFEMGKAMGTLVVPLRGRPIESYVRIVGSTGLLVADFVRGTLTKLPGPGASAPSIIPDPYSQSRQIGWETSKSIAHLLFRKQKSYTGLSQHGKASYRNY